jgi:SanA protein
MPRLKQKIFKKLFWGFLLLAGLLIGVILLVNWRINRFAKPFLYDDIAQVPENEVGLVLGTSKRLADGRKNLYFQYRIEAAVKLYKAGKIKYVLVSGDNAQMSYNEPRDMKKSLVKRGIPEEVIYLDFAGFRTFDSVVRAKKIFGQNHITIISQKFHNQRALYIASQNGMQAIGFNARDVNLQNGFKTMVREKFARIKVFLDLYIFNTQPKFLGDKVFIGENLPQTTLEE